MQPYELSVSAASDLIKSRALSPVELTASVLDRMEATEPLVNAYALTLAENARAAAEVAEHEISSGHYKGPFHGIPIGIKDLYNMRGLPTTASSRVRDAFVPTQDSAVVEKLTAAGAVIVGKTHTHEFAFGGVTPGTSNPWNTQFIAGGSSGGSAAAVAAGSCLMATGSDTGGSIRIPAAFCGMVGLKPTYGLVSRRGVTSLSWSLDHAGPITRNVADAALALTAMAGYDDQDPGSLKLEARDYSADLDGGVSGLRVGVPSNFYFDRVDSEVVRRVEVALGQFEQLGASLVEIEVPMTDYVEALEWAILLPEANAYHSEMLRSSGDLYTPEVRTMLEAGEFVFAKDYIQALRGRALMQNAWRSMFGQIDVLAAPTLSSSPARHDHTHVTWPDGSSEALTESYMRLSAPANLLGLPALSVPIGTTEIGLPIGMQIVGRPLEDRTVLRAGNAYEKAFGQFGKTAPLLAVSDTSGRA